MEKQQPIIRNVNQELLANVVAQLVLESQEQLEQLNIVNALLVMIDKLLREANVDTIFDALKGVGDILVIISGGETLNDMCQGIADDIKTIIIEMGDVLDDLDGEILLDILNVDVDRYVIYKKYDTSKLTKFIALGAFLNILRDIWYQNVREIVKTSRFITRDQMAQNETKEKTETKSKKSIPAKTTGKKDH